jgi:hypothetical protein
MAFIKILPNTNPIPQSILASTPFSFTSGGGGSGGNGVTIYTGGTNSKGWALPAGPVTIQPGNNANLVADSMNFMGGKSALMIFSLLSEWAGSSSAGGSSDTNAVLTITIQGIHPLSLPVPAVNQVGAIGNFTVAVYFDWNTLITTTAGIIPVTVNLANNSVIINGNPAGVITANKLSLSVMEFI